MEMILINGKIHTMDKNRSIAEALCIKDGKIQKVGKNEEILLRKSDTTKVIDLKGKTAVPGFNDSHVHFLNYGYSLKKVDCSNATSVEEIIELGKKFILDNDISAGEWVLGRGWNQVLFNKDENITRYDLDKISTDHPLCFTRICEHIVVANSKAIELAGITNKTEQPLGGHFDVDESGNPTGVFNESARYMIYEMIPEAGKEEIKDMILNVSNIAASYGITSVQSDDFETFADKDYTKIIEAYEELAEEKLLPVRIYEQCLLPEIDRLKEFLSKGHKTGKGNQYFKLGPLKLLTDGSLGGRTAYLCEAYNDDPSTRGISVFTQDELDDLIVTAHENGMQVLTHAIGDCAMHMCFESFSKANAQLHKADPRFGIVHLQITTDELIEKFEEFNVIAFAEPICINNDLHMAENRVGKNRILSSYKYKTLFDKKIHVCISSDCPVDSLNPMKSIYVAVTRKDYNGYPDEGWFPDECLSVDQAVYGFTMGSAYASFEENIKGSIEEGKYADIAILSEDIFEIPPDDIKDVAVEMTIMDGNLVYEI